MGTLDRKKKVEEIVLGARPLEGSALEDFLHDACGDDDQLFQDVVTHLARAEDSRSDTTRPLDTLGSGSPIEFRHADGTVLPW